MYVLYCDRCGKIIKSKKERFLIRTFNFDEDLNNKNEESDLCEDCKNKLERFLKGAELNNDL